MIKSRHMYFVIATMALGYTSTASAVKLDDANGHWAHIGNTADEVPCAACSPQTASDFEDTNTWNEWWAGFVEDTNDEHGNFSCRWQDASETSYIFPIGTESELYNGKQYDCTASGWELRGSSMNGTFDYNNGTIVGGTNCKFQAEGGSQYYYCSSCTSVSCNDGFYGNPTDCRVAEFDCDKCPDSSYKKAIGGSGSFYTCTTILQSGQSMAGVNRTISGCKIPRFYGGSDGAYCNDNGFFIWDSECSYAG